LSSDERDFALFIGTVIGLAALVGVLVFAAVTSPLWGGVAFVIIAVWRYYTSPAMKERKAKELTQALYDKAVSLAPPPPPPEDELSRALYELEGFAPPPPVPPICNSIEGARYRDKLTEYINSSYDPKRAERFHKELSYVLPPPPEKGLFTASRPLSNDELQSLCDSVFGEHDFFMKVRRQLDANLKDQKFVLPQDYRGDDAAHAYLRNTPLLPLGFRQVGIDLVNRTHHTHIVAGSGWGKTTLLEHLIHNDLKDDCCVIVIDNQRQIIPKLAHLDLDDITYLSPHHSLGINLFDVKTSGEQQTNAVVELLEYVLGGLMQAELTPRQQLIFQFSIQLAIAIPQANIHTFLRILGSRRGDYASVMGKLPPLVQEFFDREFYHDQYSTTKKEIGWRIWSMLKNPTFARIFSAPKNPVNMYELMKKKLVLIDTDINLLSEEGSSFFGRFFIAQVLQAARMRFEGEHKPAYLYIDEAPIYFDRKLASMLEQARKANIGVILAHQDLEQARRRDILNSLMGNTATKFAGGLSDADARAMAANMNTTPEFIKAQKPHNFALKSDMTYSVAVPLSGYPRRNDIKELVSRMEKLYGSPSESAALPEPMFEAPELAMRPQKADTAPKEW
jgi:hypothetical protein